MLEPRKNVTELSVQAVHVLSEPGDATRYDYLAFRYEDRFVFVCYGGSIAYPTVVPMGVVEAIGYIRNFREVSEAKEAEVVKLAEYYECNPCSPRSWEVCLYCPAWRCYICGAKCA
jgi:hypothetical protein